jgi:hypothetical protein
MLAAGCHGGTIAELGTGAGIGAAWISSAMPADCRLVTAELDASLAAAAAELLAGDPRISVLAGDAADLLPQHAPFDVLFADCGIRDPGTFGGLTALLRPGGRIVMDDLVPARAPGGSDSGSSHIKRDLFAGPPASPGPRLFCPSWTARCSSVPGTRLRRHDRNVAASSSRPSHGVAVGIRQSPAGPGRVRNGRTYLTLHGSCDGRGQPRVLRR